MFAPRRNNWSVVKGGTKDLNCVILARAMLFIRVHTNILLFAQFVLENPGEFTSEIKL